MRKEKSRDAARSRRSKENHEFYELAKLLPLPAAITSQLDFLDKASIIRLTISFLKLRQFSVNGHPAWAPDFTTLGSVNPYSSQSVSNSFAGEQYSQEPASRPASTAKACEDAFPTPSSSVGPAEPAFSQQQQPTRSANLFDLHQGTHILQSLDGFAFAIGRDGKFLYISETVSMYLGLSQVEMTGSSVFDYTHQQDHEELAKQLGIAYSASQPTLACNQDLLNPVESPATSVRSQYSAASNETLLDEYVNTTAKRPRGAYGASHRPKRREVKAEPAASSSQHQQDSADSVQADGGDKVAARGADAHEERDEDLPAAGTSEDPLVRQFCIRMKSTLTKRGCQHFKSSGYRVVHVVAHLRSYQSNDHGHLMDPLDDPAAAGCSSGVKQQAPATQQPTTKRKRDQQTKVKFPSAGSSKAIGSLECEPVHADQQQQQAAAKPAKIIGLVAVAIALPPPSINELRLESDTFVLRLGLDLRVTHIEPKITELLHYPIEFVAGRSLYSLVHPADVQQVQRCHKDLLKKGQMMSGYYRLLSRTGGYIWIQTCATLICNNTLAGHSNSALPSSPSLSTITTASDYHNNNNNSTKLLPLPGTTNYLPPLEQQQPFAGGAKQQTASPASHLSSSTNFGSDQMFDQDQCVIFVNYMITNVLESDQIVDICQSAICTPLPSSAAASGSSFSGTASLFNSPSTCSSPSISCHTNNKTTGSYPSPPTRPTSRRQQTEPVAGNATSSKRDARLANGSATRRTPQHQGKAAHLTPNQANKSKSSYLSISEHAGGYSADALATASCSTYNMDQQQHHHHLAYEQQQQQPMAQQDSLAPIYAGYQHHSAATSGGVNLAFASKDSPATWLTSRTSQHHQHQHQHHHHQQQQQQQQGDYGRQQAVNSSESSNGDHYSLMNRSIYKAAALCLDSATNYTANHQQAPPASAVVYPPAAAAAAVASYAAAAVASTTPSVASAANTWDSAAAAAVAAASNHHHHHLSSHPSAAANPYAPQTTPGHHPSYYYGYYM